MKRRDRSAIGLMIIVLLAAALTWLMFKTGYYENWLSINSILIADARFLAETWPYPG